MGDEVVKFGYSRLWFLMCFFAGIYLLQAIRGGVEGSSVGQILLGAGGVCVGLWYLIVPFITVSSHALTFKKSLMYRRVTVSFEQIREHHFPKPGLLRLNVDTRGTWRTVDIPIGKMNEEQEEAFLKLLEERLGSVPSPVTPNEPSL